MSYLHCSRCGLQIKIQAPFMSVENCPRCLARSATVSPLVHSPTWSRPPVGWGPDGEQRLDAPARRRGAI